MRLIDDDTTQASCARSNLGEGNDRKRGTFDCAFHKPTLILLALILPLLTTCIKSKVDYWGQPAGPQEELTRGFPRVAERLHSAVEQERQKLMDSDVEFDQFQPNRIDFFPNCERLAMLNIAPKLTWAGLIAALVAGRSLGVSACHAAAGQNSHAGPVIGVIDDIRYGGDQYH